MLWTTVLMLLTVFGCQQLYAMFVSWQMAEIVNIVEMRRMKNLPLPDVTVCRPDTLTFPPTRELLNTTIPIPFLSQLIQTVKADTIKKDIHLLKLINTAIDLLSNIDDYVSFEIIRGNICNYTMQSHSAVLMYRINPYHPSLRQSEICVFELDIFNKMPSLTTISLEYEPQLSLNPILCEYNHKSYQSIQNGCLKSTNVRLLMLVNNEKQREQQLKEKEIVNVNISLRSGSNKVALLLSGLQGLEHIVLKYLNVAEKREQSPQLPQGLRKLPGMLQKYSYNDIEFNLLVLMAKSIENEEYAEPKSLMANLERWLQNPPVSRYNLEAAFDKLCDTTYKGLKSEECTYQSTIKSYGQLVGIINYRADEIYKKVYFGKLTRSKPNTVAQFFLEAVLYLGQYLNRLGIAHRYNLKIIKQLSRRHAGSDLFLLDLFRLLTIIDNKTMTNPS